jgi:CHAD domain-containing protein
MDSSDSAARTAAPPSPGAHLRAYATAELARAIACLGWRGPRLHTGVHQARKSLRRTRATLALGGPALGPGLALVDRELRRVNTRLSELRDAHALIETLDHLQDKHGDDPELAAVLRRVRRNAAGARAARARAVLATDPQLHERRALLAVLQAALGALSWDALSADGVREALHTSAARADEAAARAQAGDRDVDWHRWRRRARRLSQQLRALDDSMPVPSEPESVKHVAVLLGQAQDYSLLREHCGRHCGFAAADRAVLRKLSEHGSTRLRERIRAELPAARRAESGAFEASALRQRAMPPGPRRARPEPLRRKPARSPAQ